MEIVAIKRYLFPADRVSFSSLGEKETLSAGKGICEFCISFLEPFQKCPRRGLPCIKWWGGRRNLLGVQIRDQWYHLGCHKSKRTTRLSQYLLGCLSVLTRLRYLLGVILKISNEHPHHFICGNPPIFQQLQDFIKYHTYC